MSAMRRMCAGVLPVQMMKYLAKSECLEMSSVTTFSAPSDSSADTISSFVSVCLHTGSNRPAA